MVKKSNSELLKSKVARLKYFDNKEKSEVISFEKLKEKADLAKNTFDEDYLRQQFNFQV